MKLRITSGAELGKLLDALAKDIVDANIYYRLFVDLMTSIDEYGKEVRESYTFWWLTVQAIKEAYLFRLCRIFDRTSKALSLVNLLDTIKANLHLFGKPHFRERMKGNAFVDSLANGARVPTIDEVQADVEFASLRNPVVNKLWEWRGSAYAHTRAKVALGETGALEDISPAELKELLDRSFSIFNKYLQLYKATTWSRQMIGHEDHQALFKLLRLGLEKYRADIRKELTRGEN